MRTDKTKVQKIIQERNKYKNNLKAIKEMIDKGLLGIHRGKTELVCLLDSCGVHCKIGV